MQKFISFLATLTVSFIIFIGIVVFDAIADVIDSAFNKDKSVQLNNSIVQQCKHPKDYAEYAYCVSAYENTETVRTLVDIQTEMSEYAAAHPEEVEAYNRKHF